MKIKRVNIAIQLSGSKLSAMLPMADLTYISYMYKEVSLWYDPLNGRPYLIMHKFVISSVHVNTTL